jgi:hypothetical protein
MVKTYYLRNLREMRLVLNKYASEARGLVEFKNGRFQTEDKEIQDAIEEGSDFHAGTIVLAHYQVPKEEMKVVEGVEAKPEPPKEEVKTESEPPQPRRRAIRMAKGLITSQNRGVDSEKE